MEEPSVLDYVIAKLKFWEKSDIRIPAPGEIQAPALDDQVAQAVEPRAEEAVLPSARARMRVRLPWMAILPVVAALLAQALLEPPNRFELQAGLLYLICAALTGLAFWSGELRMAPLPAYQARPDHMNMRWVPAMAGVPFAILSFYLFHGNRFNLLNVSLWLVALALFLVGFVDRTSLPNCRGWLRSMLRPLRTAGQAWHFQISPWALLLAAVLVLIAFFRFYHLDLLPIDMVSDHAEKLLDVNDILNGKYSIFFERNTGREPFQFYWTVLVAKILGGGASFLNLKIGTVLTGLVVLYYTYRLGLLVANRWVALLALLFVGVAYWPNVISRIALRFPLYPFFVAPLLFFLIRGLRTGARNDFIWAGLWLGIGLNGYTSSRVVPLLVVVAVGFYLLHRQSRGFRQQAIMDLILVALFALILCLPLFRYATENPGMFFYRALTRMGNEERAFPGNPLVIFISNTWNALILFFYRDGNVWVHSVPERPAFDMVMAALFFVGGVLLAARYVKERHWEDIFLLVSIPILLLPSILSLAFPDENPVLNRPAAAYVPALLIAAIGLEALLRSLVHHLPQNAGRVAAAVVAIILVSWTVSNNFDLFFHQYDQVYKQSAWNTRDMGQAAREFAQVTGAADTYYVVGYPYWADSRQVAIFAGHIERDPAIQPDQLQSTFDDPRSKLFILKPEDSTSLATLRRLYPQGWAERKVSPVAGKDFDLFFVPARQDQMP